MARFPDEPDDLREAREAREDARIATEEVDVVVASVHQTNQNIRSLVRENGYVERFRRVLRGA